MVDTSDILLFRGVTSCLFEEVETVVIDNFVEEVV